MPTYGKWWEFLICSGVDAHVFSKKLLHTSPNCTGVTWLFNCTQHWQGFFVYWKIELYDVVNSQFSGALHENMSGIFHSDPTHPACSQGVGVIERIGSDIFSGNRPRCETVGVGGELLEVVTIYGQESRCHMDVRGTPKSSTVNRVFYYFHHPFWGKHP